MLKQQTLPKITVYEPSATKSNKYVKRNDQHPNISDFGASENRFENDGVVSSDSARNVFLRGNPFLYNPNSAAYKATSLEEYLISVDKVEIAFGDVIRNPVFGPKKRKKIIKNAFKAWDKEYNKLKNTAFKESDKVVEVIGEVNYLSFSIKMKVLMMFLFTLLLFIMGTTSAIWERISTSSIGYYINQTLVSMFTGAVWLNVLGNITIYIILILIFYSSLYSIISNDFKRNYKLAQSFLTRSEKTISNNYKRKFKNARKYYYSLINRQKNPFFAPLAIEEVEEGQVNITIFNNICKMTIDRAYMLKKSRPYIIAIKKFLVFGSIIGSATLCLFSLYHIIINLF